MTKSKGTGDDVDMFYYYGIYPPSRTLYIGSNDGAKEDAIGAKTTSEAIKGLHLLDIVFNHVVPITIMINTYGGDTYDSYAIFDAIENCQNHVVTKGIGKVMSAGAVILQAGDERTMTKNCRLMLHYGSWGVDSKNGNVDNDYNEGKYVDKWQLELWYKVLKEKNRKTTKKSVETLLKKDSYFSAEQCLELGIIDRII